MKRVLLFLLTNLAVMLVLGVAARLLGVDRFLQSNGLNLSALLGFALIMGFGGATTVLDTKIVGLSRLPASYFVSVSYMCWAYSRRKMTVKGAEVIYD